MQARIARRGDADAALARFGITHGHKEPSHKQWVYWNVWLYDVEGSFLGHSDLTYDKIIAMVDGLAEGERIIGVDHRRARPIHRRLMEEAERSSGGKAPEGFCCHCGLAQDGEKRHYTERDPTLEMLAPVAGWIWERGSFRSVATPVGLENINRQLSEHGADFRLEPITREDVHRILCGHESAMQPA